MGFGNLSTYLCFHGLPSFTQTLPQEGPHLFAHLLVSLCELFELHAIPILRMMTLDHEPFMTLAACIWSLIWEEPVRNGVQFSPAARAAISWRSDSGFQEELLVRVLWEDESVLDMLMREESLSW